MEVVTGDDRESEITKGNKKTSGVHYPDFGNGFVGINIGQNFSKCTLLTGVL